MRDVAAKHALIERLQEASAVLRVKTETLKSRLHRERLMLREKLGEFMGGLSQDAAA